MRNRAGGRVVDGKGGFTIEGGSGVRGWGLGCTDTSEIGVNG